MKRVHVVYSLQSIRCEKMNHNHVSLITECVLNNRLNGNDENHSVTHSCVFEIHKYVSAHFHSICLPLARSQSLFILMFEIFD